MKKLLMLAVLMGLGLVAVGCGPATATTSKKDGSTATTSSKKEG